MTWAWSHWRRRHQCRARQAHCQRRQTKDHEVLLECNAGLNRVEVITYDQLVETAERALTSSVVRMTAAPRHPLVGSYASGLTLICPAAVHSIYLLNRPV